MTIRELNCAGLVEAMMTCAANVNGDRTRDLLREGASRIEAAAKLLMEPSPTVDVLRLWEILDGAPDLEG